MSGTVRVNNKKCNTSWHFEVSVILLFITGSSAFLISCSCSEGTMLKQFELRANCDGRIQQQTKQHISYIKARLRKVSSANMSLCPPPITSRKPAPEKTDKVGSAVILAYRDMWIEVQNSVCVWGGSREDSVLQHGVWVCQAGILVTATQLPMSGYLAYCGLWPQRLPRLSSLHGPPNNAAVTDVWNLWLQICVCGAGTIWN